VPCGRVLKIGRVAPAASDHCDARLRRKTLAPGVVTQNNTPIIYQVKGDSGGSVERIAGMVEWKGERVALYKDQDGKL
jgi:hypothetical protein